MEDSVFPSDPGNTAQATLFSLHKLIEACTPENQPSPEVLRSFLALYREVKGTPEGMAKTLADILDSQERTARALTALTGQAIGATIKQRSWTQ
jgi:hypothetical protein